LILDHTQRHLLVHQDFLGLAAHWLVLAHTLAIRNDRSMSSGGVRAATMVVAELWILGFCKG
jgi:hypothetical protein